MTADATEPLLGVSARYAEQIRDFIEARAQERQAAREESARLAALAEERAQRLEEASSRATQEAVRIDIRSAPAPVPPGAETTSPTAPSAEAARPAAPPSGIAAPAAVTPTPALVETIRPGALLDTQV